MPFMISCRLRASRPRYSAARRTDGGCTDQGVWGIGAHPPGNTVRAKGLEPPRCFHQQDLDLPRLPFRHARERCPPAPVTKLYAQVLLQAINVPRGLDGVVRLLDLAVGADHERGPDHAHDLL